MEYCRYRPCSHGWDGCVDPLATRRWIARPISELMDGIQRMAKGDLNTHIDLKKGDELSQLAQAFNQMATFLKEAQERIFREAEARLELERNLRHSEKLATIGQACLRARP